MLLRRVLGHARCVESPSDSAPLLARTRCFDSWSHIPVSGNPYPCSKSSPPSFDRRQKPAVSHDNSISLGDSPGSNGVSVCSLSSRQLHKPVHHSPNQPPWDRQWSPSSAPATLPPWQNPKFRDRKNTC